MVLQITGINGYTFALGLASPSVEGENSLVFHPAIRFPS
jgi:hypothetical protein